MAYAVLKFANEPIAIAKIQLPLEHSLCAARQLWITLNQHADTHHAPWYAIIDLSNEAIDFADILLWLDHRRTDPGIRYRSPHLRVIVVGQHPMVALAVRKYNRQFDDPVIHLPTIDQALSAARHALMLENASQFPA